MAADITRDMLFLWAHQPFEAALNGGVKLRRDAQQVVLRPPVDWHCDPFEDRNWRFNLHALRAVDPALEADIDTPDATAFAFALDWTLDWWRAHGEEGQTSEFAEHDMAVGLRAGRIAYLLARACAGDVEVSKSDLERLKAAAERHLDLLSDESFLARSNHALFQIVGLHALGLALEQPDASETARRFLNLRLADWYTPRGVHKEHSPEYQAFVTRELSRLPAGLHDPALDNFIAGAAAVSDALFGADARIYEIGDSGGDGAPSSPGAGTNVKLGGRDVRLLDLHQDGYVAVQAADESLITYAAAFSTVHKHADDLAFIWSDAKGPLLIDGGKYGYDRDEKRRYLTSARAHNTVSLERLLPGPGDIDRPEGGSGFIETRAGAKRGLEVTGLVERPGLFRHRRRLQYRPGALIKIEDRIRNRTRFAAESLLQIDGDAELIDETGSSIRIQRGGTDLRVEWKGGRLHRYFGSEDPEYGWRSRDYRRVEPCHTLALRRIGPAARLRWRIEILSLGEAPS